MKKTPAKTAEITVLPPEKPGALVDVSAAFAAARAHVTELRDLGRRANHVSILLGAELNRLHREFGIGRGGNRRSNPQNDGLIRWEDLVERETGLSIATCSRLMKLAEAGKKFIPVLTSADVLETPFSALPEARQAEVKKAIAKVSDAGTMQQLMLDFGVIPPPKKANTPPPGGKSAKNDFKGGAATRSSQADDELITLEMQRELALEHLQQLQDMAASGAWESLDDGDLAALNGALDTWQQQTAALLKARAEQTAKAAGKKGGGR